MYTIRLVVLSAILAACAVAQTPLGTGWTYQGRLKDGGSPANGPHDLQFTLYDVPAGGAIIAGPLCVDNVNVADGLFTVPLDFGAVFDGNERWLEIGVRNDNTIGNCAGGSYTPLSQRQPLTAAPNALLALNADKLDGLDSTAFLQAVPNPLTLSGSNPLSHIISGENAAATNNSYGVYGRSTAGSGNTYGVFGRTDSTGGAGVLGFAASNSGTTIGVEGTSVSPDGRGVYGYATWSSGTTTGVWGRCFSTSGRGVFGQAQATSGVTYGGRFENSSTSGYGVFGLASASSGDTFGLWGQSDSTSGFGVFGDETATSGTTQGVYGRSASTGGRGVFGYASATSGSTHGGYFQNQSTGGVGAFGYATATSGTTYGLFGQSDSTTGRGVYGLASVSSGATSGVYGQSDSTSGRGVYGWASASSGTIFGVYGQASTAAAGYAVYANGDTGGSGNKAFRIDHPLDPENKYLLHYSTESPEVINFYRGTVMLNERGEAVVELPNYFASINKDPSYQLTAVGTPMPMLHVAEEISGDALAAGEQAGPGIAPPLCAFRVAGGTAGGKVSWRVEALRNDLRNRLHGAPVEREKTGLERGKYQHPEFYGQPPQRGLDYAPERALPGPAATGLSDAVR
ncbi:hypothetical protein RAS1_02950 [Phycisphaerae bacterium RAS1]|nr:hypothetical protein RAS1_02950 [Phycisphaerae bacterium RAS1]